jgi:hypothetical protein
MTTLKDLLGTPPKRQAVVTDACQVLDAEVDDKGGLSGLAIKAAYAVIKGIKPGFIPEVVDSLMDDFLGAFEPHYARAQAAGVSPGAELKRSAGQAAESLLAITDARAARANRPVIQKTYDKLRPTAKKHVESAMPRVADLLDRHVRVN